MHGLRFKALRASVGAGSSCLLQLRYATGAGRRVPMQRKPSAQGRSVFTSSRELRALVAAWSSSGSIRAAELKLTRRVRQRKWRVSARAATCGIFLEVVSSIVIVRVAARRTRTFTMGTRSSTPGVMATAGWTSRRPSQTTAWRLTRLRRLILRLRCKRRVGARAALRGIFLEVVSSIVIVRVAAWRTRTYSMGTQSSTPGVMAIAGRTTRRPSQSTAASTRALRRLVSAMTMGR